MDLEGIVSQRPRRERCHVALTTTVTPRLFGLRHMPRVSESHMQPPERTSGTQGTSHVGECVVVVSEWCADHILCQPSMAKCPAVPDRSEINQGLVTVHLRRVRGAARLINVQGDPVR